MPEKAPVRSRIQRSPLEMDIFANKDAYTRFLAVGNEHILHQSQVGALFDMANRAAINMFFDTRFTQILAGKSEYIRTAFAQNPSPYVQPNEEKTRLLNALLYHNFEGIAQDSNDYIELLKANSLKEQIARMFIQEAVMNPENPLGLSLTQRDTIYYGTLIADVVDEAHIAWYQEVNQGPTFKQLGAKRDKWVEENRMRKSQGLEENPIDPAWELVEPSFNGKKTGDYLYVMFRQEKEDGPIKAVPCSEAFPDHTQRIVSIIKEMTDALSANGDSDPDKAGIIAVHNAWKDLLVCHGDTEEQTRLAKNLDAVGMTTATATSPSNVVQILYPMEAYQDIFQKMVEWDYAVMFKDKRYEALNKRAEDRQNKMLSYFESANSPLFGNLALRESLAKVRDSRSVIYAQMSGGTSLGFLPAASNYPNNPDQRKNGSKIRQNMETIRQRAEISNGHLQLLFKERIDDTPESDYLAKTFGTVEQRVESVAGDFIPLHEHAHNLLIIDDTNERLTSELLSNVEEAKADICAVVIALSTFGTFEEKAAFIRSTFAENLRGLTRFADTVDRSHYNGDVLLIQLLLDANILTKDANGKKGWDFTITPDSIETVLSQATTVLKAFGDAYDERDVDLARLKMHNLLDYFKESQKIYDLEVDAGIMSKEEYQQRVLPLAS